MVNNSNPLPSSYKDPSGFVFKQNSTLYRFICPLYKQEYDHLMQSGLYDGLVEKKWLIPHSDVTKSMQFDDAYKIIKPQQIPFINYPYEWSFSQIKDAALLTLDICLHALEYGMVLKDASAFNIVYFEGRPIFIDTLSFDLYREGEPWVAYGQFCRHFLCCLSLASFCDLRFIPLIRNFLDGFPLDLTAKLLPRSTLLQVGLMMHLHLHAKAQLQMGDNKATVNKEKSMSKRQLTALIRSLRATISSLKFPKTKTEWGNYELLSSYSHRGLEDKRKIIKKIFDKNQFKTVLDLGGNDGAFSRLAVNKKNLVISTDNDLQALEKNYQTVKSHQEVNILPLYLDVTNPSGAIGFNLEERDDFFSRGSFDCVLVLALLHHLAISNNFPFKNIAQLLSRITERVVIEFIPKEDKMVKKLLHNRKDIFENYTQDNFEKIFKNYFSILKKYPIKDSKRVVYFLRKKSSLRVRS